MIRIFMRLPAPVALAACGGPAATADPMREPWPTAVH